MKEHEAKYKCGYCEKEFEAKYQSTSGEGRNSNGVSKIKCPRCGNLLKTLEDQIKYISIIKSK